MTVYRPSPMVMFHHDKKWNDASVLQLMEEVGDQELSDGRPITDEDRTRWLNHLGRPSYEGGISLFHYRFDREYSPQVSRTIQGMLDISLFVRNLSGPGGEILRPKALVEHGREWVVLYRSVGDLNHKDAKEAQIILNRARRLAEFLKSDFTMADLKNRIARFGETDPREIAWPLMIVGGDLVTKLGKDHLMDTPAWKVEELSYGAIWIQAWENPFECPEPMVAKVAKHLGLRSRNS